MDPDSHGSGGDIASTIRRAREPLDITALTRRMTAGDESAYRSFYEEYFDRLFRYLLVVTSGDEHATREALQITMDRIVRHMRPFGDEAVFWSWLTVLARSALADERRKRRRYLVFLDRFAREMDVSKHDDPGIDADERMRELLAKGLDQLTDDERALLQRKYTDRQSVREIAAESGTSEKSVESRLARARLKLKASMLKELTDEPRT